jgi:hypothetical protein
MNLLEPNRFTGQIKQVFNYLPILLNLVNIITHMQGGIKTGVSAATYPAGT